MLALSFSGFCRRARRGLINTLIVGLSSSEKALQILKGLVPRQVLTGTHRIPSAEIQRYVAILLYSFWSLPQIQGYVAWVCPSFVGLVFQRG